MLQIVTGKFFRDVELYKTQQRGVLYSNYSMLLDPIKTVSGTLVPTWGGQGVKSIIYEVEERLEAFSPDGRAEVLVAVGGNFLVQDFAAVTSFVLNVICTPDFDLTRRLTQTSHPSLGVPKSPREYVRRVFDESVEYAPGDDTKLSDFIRDLTGLKRKEYEAAIRAIRRYCVALNRIGDDLEMAYTMFVASIESLAQGFDSFVPTWEDYEANKRIKIDKALTNVSADIAADIRGNIISGEHLALSRRFREFALSHISPSYFREDATHEVGPVRRSDLSKALEIAYKFRSKAVHTLHELPRYMTTAPSYRDTEYLEGQTVLSIQGMARLSRHIIFEFVKRGVKVEKEELDYRELLPNIVKVRLAERYWIGRPEGFNHNSVKRYLSGFISELASIELSHPDASLTDLTLVMEEIEKQVKGLAKPQQVPLVTLYILFNGLIPAEKRRPKFSSFVDKHWEVLASNVPEAMLIPVLGFFPNNIIWRASDFEEAWTMYAKQRQTSSSLDFGAFFDVATLLTWAECCRIEGNRNQAIRLVSKAVEELPGNASLLNFESSLLNNDTDELPEIKWRTILLPAKSNDPSQQGESSIEYEI